jgi:hypothetical protein
LDSNPTPTVAALAVRLFFKKERRSACLRIAVSECFIVFFLLCVDEFDFVFQRALNRFPLARQRSTRETDPVERRRTDETVSRHRSVPCGKIAGLVRSVVTARSKRSQGLARKN